MSSVAVLTQESFAEHRSGLVPQQIKGDRPLSKSLLTSETGLLCSFVLVGCK
ncbi:high density lipoprotein (HDL) binding protein, isoform CRA_c [Mus musculus]|jgi:hypothetical protein|nr:high density lipoprotein (HDL) binding protein, isoform CRA_c [Mus musculus]